MIETLVASGEFEQPSHREVEQKFLPIFPEQLSPYRESAYPIEQIYLSHPDEDFNLRLRETFIGGELRYTATIKDRGTLTEDGLDRLEVETTISPEAYAFYKSSGAPLLRKLRANPHKNIAIDFFEDGHIHVESENPLSWRAFSEHYGITGNFVDMTGDRMLDNEWRAHFAYRRDNHGKEALTPKPDLDVEAASQTILEHYYKSPFTLVEVSGRSGSGKSTRVKQIKERLEAIGVKCDIVSTDDYHRGASWLQQHNGGEPWTHWDDAIVYDTAALAQDIESLRNGQAVPRRWIDFSVAEPAYDGMREPAPILIVEGIYTKSPDLASLYQLRFDVPTGTATSIGRRLLRDIKERPQFADPEASLRYMLEEAEIAWRKQHN